MHSDTKFANFIKRRKVTLIAVLAFALALVVVVSAASNRAVPDPVGEISAESEEQVSEAASLEGCGLYIDGRFIAAFGSEASAKAALERYYAQCDLSGYDHEGVDPVVTGLANKVEFTAGVYDVDGFVSADEFISLMSSRDLGVNLRLCYSTTLSVVSSIEHVTKNIYTDSLVSGRINVVTAGSDGEQRDTYTLEYVNGDELSRSLVESEVLLDAVDEVVEIGTYNIASRITASTGVFSRPYDGIVTSEFKFRWGRMHNGIDIWTGDCYGKPALSAADGVVKFAGARGGYGNCVVVDHGEGIETLYAHLCSISVSEGEIVSSGDEIGLIGETGAAQGAHLHFEVHVDGEAVNPRLFVDYAY